jgi:hypothetical protein
LLTVLVVAAAHALVYPLANTHALLRAGVLAALAIVCLTLPFYLYEPRQFTPLEGADRRL